MKNHYKFICLLSALLFFGPEKCPAKNVILFVMETNAYNALGGGSGTISTIRNLVQDWDDKICPLITWNFPTGTNYQMCQPLYTELQNQFIAARNNGNVLEGVILIGRVPVPLITIPGNPPDVDVPLDHVYMDLVNSVGAAYSVSPYYDAANQIYSPIYNNPPGDGVYDIWVSRINANYLTEGIREKGVIYDENSVYQQYFDRWFMRMNYAATVPMRGFIMGGCADVGYPNLHNVLGDMRILNLGWLAEFTDHHSTSFNWASQLLAGPRGCITYGAFNNSLFPNPSTRNRRFCLYNNLPVVYPRGSSNPVSMTVPSGDSLGWEWAGVYNHSHPLGTNFRDRLNPSSGPILQGNFGYGTLGPFWGGATYTRTGGYNGSYHVYKDTVLNPNPYQYGLRWKGKGASWRWVVPTTGNYKIYVYYVAPVSPNPPNTENCAAVEFRVMQSPVSNGVPFNPTTPTVVTINQQIHTNYSATNNQMEVLVNSMNLTAGNMFIVEISANDAAGGFRIADAIVLRRTNSSTYTYIDDATPASYPDVYNNPSGIFSTTGFFTNDYINRAYEDLGTERGGGGINKTPFYCHNACEINKFTAWRAGLIDKNIGTLYALGQKGLVCMGAATVDIASIHKTPFFESLAMGSNMGQAFRVQQQANFNRIIYSLLGAGAIRAQPYIQFESHELRNQTYSTSVVTLSTPKPVFIKNVTVNQNGGLLVTSTYNAANSPAGSFSEVKVRESTFSPTGTRTVTLKAL